MRIAFINSTGGKMFVDESRVEEYKAAGYIPAADVIDSVAVEIEDAPVKKSRTRSKRQEE